MSLAPIFQLKPENPIGGGGGGGGGGAVVLFFFNGHSGILQQ